MFKDFIVKHYFQGDIFPFFGVGRIFGGPANLEKIDMYRVHDGKDGNKVPHLVHATKWAKQWKEPLHPTVLSLLPENK